MLTAIVSVPVSVRISYVRHVGDQFNSELGNRTRVRTPITHGRFGAATMLRDARTALDLHRAPGE